MVSFIDKIKYLIDKLPGLVDSFSALEGVSLNLYGISFKPREKQISVSASSLL